MPTILYGDELLQYFDPAMGDNRTYALWLESLWAIDWGANQPEHYQSMYVNYQYMGTVRLLRPGPRTMTRIP